MRRFISLFLALSFISLFTIGCGETVSGIGKDAKRIGKGIKTVFVKDK